MVRTCARWVRVPYAVKRGVSQRQACALMGVSRSPLGYVSPQAEHQSYLTAVEQGGSADAAQVSPSSSRQCACQVQRASEATWIWACDFVFNTSANGQPFKWLTVIDEHPARRWRTDVAGSIRSERVIEVLSRLISERGAPKAVLSDNGPYGCSNGQPVRACR